MNSQARLNRTAAEAAEDAAQTAHDEAVNADPLTGEHGAHPCRGGSLQSDRNAYRGQSRLSWQEASPSARVACARILQGHQADL